MTSPVVFLDKDGTLVENVPMNVDPRRITLTHGVREALRRLHQRGFRIAVVSNQPGVAHGLFDERALEGVALRVQHLLGAAGVPLGGFFYCPHHPQGRIAAYARRCECRKPAPGLVRRAAARLDADLARSWMVGDILDDVEAGRRAGCRTMLFDSGGETEWVITAGRQPDHVATSFTEVADRILADAERGR
jgi:histidinol-phosphate phosphatase family protein